MELEERNRKKKKKYLHPWTVRPVCQDRLLGKGSKARSTSTSLKRGVDAGMGKGHGIAMMGPNRWDGKAWGIAMGEP